MKKSWIGTDVITFYCYVERPGSWELSQPRKPSIAAMILSRTQKQMQSFFRAANFIHTPIPNYAQWTSDLYECTTAAFNWSPNKWPKDYRALFNKFKVAIKTQFNHKSDRSLWKIAWRVLRLELEIYSFLNSSMLSLKSCLSCWLISRNIW